MSTLKDDPKCSGPHCVPAPSIDMRPLHDVQANCYGPHCDPAPSIDMRPLHDAPKCYKASLL
jgi:hypothetical protein